MLKFLKRRQPSEGEAALGQGWGILVFENTSEVIRAEAGLRAAGWEVKVMGPPPELRTGCDLVIRFPLIEQLNIIRSLENLGIPPLEAVPVTDPLLKPVDLFLVKDLGAWLMIRAANMKLTVEKESRKIVNISGGGCPDVPYLAALMVGRDLESAPQPRELGHTLCGYALQLAYEEMLRKCFQS
ncbi:DUF3343 domain-containing protein [Dethiosulfatarculus sandiegensis]|uniref:DUF3343 domain-containing protein n=1 Tax=Dethiosulfatarculus sandiegensis TaxID=1429043 RepID=UPI0005CAD517|nr:DUF3343 domain-containing protein [Dethiosulfatarculus sandiegensis]